MKLIRQMITAIVVGAFVLASGVLFALPAQAATPQCSSSTPVTQRPVLSYGDTGNCVKFAQGLMSKAGYQLKQHVTGNFLTITRSNVKAFQKAKGISTTGNIGPLTWSALSKAKPTPKPKSLSPQTSYYLKREARVVDVNQTEQVMRIYEHGKLRFKVKVALGGKKINPKTGKYQDYRSDNGAFRVFWKNADHKSSLFNNAAMPYAVFYNGGEAIHYSPTFDRVGYGHTSHGCVNVGDVNTAKKIYSLLKVGDVVIVHGKSPVP